MAYGNYAPFYRGGYFNPMQTPTVPNMQENQFAYQQPMQQPQTNNEMLWVLNENEAVSFPVAPNNSVVLWDKNNPTIYVKSVNAQGVPSMRILDFTERTEAQKTAHASHECKCGDKFVTKQAFEDLSRNFDDLRAKVDAMTEKPKAKAKRVEEE